MNNEENRPCLVGLELRGFTPLKFFTTDEDGMQKIYSFAYCIQIDRQMFGFANKDMLETEIKRQTSQFEGQLTKNIDLKLLRSLVGPAIDCIAGIRMFNERSFEVTINGQVSRTYLNVRDGASIRISKTPPTAVLNPTKVYSAVDAVEKLYLSYSPDKIVGDNWLGVIHHRQQNDEGALQTIVSCNYQMRVNLGNSYVFVKAGNRFIKINAETNFVCTPWVVDDIKGIESLGYSDLPAYDSNEIKTDTIVR